LSLFSASRCISLFSRSSSAAERSATDCVLPRSGER
jgi:hypothetical protein